MDKGKHFTREDRLELAKMLERGYSLRRIAIRLNRNVSNVSREIKRNRRAKDSRHGTPLVYDPTVANQKAYARRHAASFKSQKIVRSTALRAFIDHELLNFQTPQAIAGRLSTGKEGLPYVSRTTIERYLSSPYGEPIRLAIRRFKHQYKRRRRRRRSNAPDDRIFIDERPDIIKHRGRVGDVEMDFIVSGTHGIGQLLTVVDRKTRKSFIRKLFPVTLDNLRRLLIEIKGEFPELKSITVDNDILLMQHNLISQTLGVPIYFCHPYSSWEKGSVENLNRFIRRFIVKGSDIHSYSTEQIHKIEELANKRFMQVLGYLTPNEAYAAR